MDNLLTLIQVLGGVGVFLLGMIVMTDGLHRLASGMVRSALMRYTRTPLSGTAIGALSTAVLQSSSATTVAVIGFVGAELMTFQNALGVIFGANVGTTVTGWMVTLVGFKLKLGVLALPLVFLGAVLHLFGRGKLKHIGFALAGFAMIFVGVSTMQEAMNDLQGLISFQGLKTDSLLGILELLGFGVLFTAITQSSSVGVAAALTALHIGVIGFDQAAMLIIGMNIGTTVTAVFAAVGGSVNAYRTAYSHVIFNIFSALIALTLLFPYIRLLNHYTGDFISNNAELALVLFHTLFKTMSVAFVLPFTADFARLIERIVSGKVARYTRPLSDALLASPLLALNAVQSAIQEELVALLYHINAIVGGSARGVRTNLFELQSALDQTHAYLDRIHLMPNGEADWQRLLSMIHAIDHMQRLHERCEEEENRAKVVQSSSRLGKQRERLIDANKEMIELIPANRWEEIAGVAGTLQREIAETADQYRQLIAADIGTGLLDVYKGTARMEAARWLTRVSDHIARITHHMQLAALAAAK